MASEIKQENVPAEVVDLQKKLIQMKTEVERLQKQLGAECVILIGIYKVEDQLRFQDVGRFPMPPEHFYEVMKNAHINGQLQHDGVKFKPTSKIIKPN